jgi:hypothetical protein
MSTTIRACLRALRNLIFLSILEAPAASLLLIAGVILVRLNIWLWFLGYVATIIRSLYKMHLASKTLAQQWQSQIIAWMHTVGLPMLFKDLGVELKLPQLGMAALNVPGLALPLLPLPVPRLELPNLDFPSVDLPNVDMPDINLPQLTLKHNLRDVDL